MKKNFYLKNKNRKVFLSLFIGFFLFAGMGTVMGADFIRITSLNDVTDGNYIIVNSGNTYAMNNSTTQVTNCLGYTSVTPVSNKITTSDASIIWRIETNGIGKSIYNAATSKFVSYTGSSNDVQVVNAVTANNQRWTFSYVSNEFRVQNISVTTRYLSYNSGSPRWACYGNTGQQQIYLYKEVPSCTNPPTFGACSNTTPLANSVTLQNAGFSAIDCAITDYGFEYGTASDLTGATVVSVGNSIAEGTSFNTNLSSLNCNTTYYYRAYAKTSLGTVYSSPIASFATVTCPPAISATPNPVNFTDVNLAGSFTPQQIPITVTGVNLANNIDYNFSDVNFSVTGSLNTTGGTLTAKYDPQSVGTHTATLTLTSASDGVQYTVTLNGKALVNCGTIPAPTVDEESDVTTRSFVANWTGSATDYLLYVYTKEESQVENVANGGFETGDKSGWTGDASAATQPSTANNFNYFTIVNSGAHSGSYAINRTEPAGSSKTARIEQIVATEVGKTYTFSFWYKNYSATDANGLKNYSLINHSTASSYMDTDGTGSTPAKLPAATTEWVKYEKTFVATGTQMRISIRSYEPVSIDDVSLTTTGNAIVPVSGYDGLPVSGTSQSVTGLTPETTYYYVVKAKGTGLCADVLSAESNEIEVELLPCPAPVIEATVEVDPFGTTMPIMAEIADDCGITDYGFVYSKESTTHTPTLDTNDGIYYSDDLEDKLFSAIITGLTCNTTYYFLSFVTNSAGITVYGDDEIKFTTEACPDCAPVANPASSVTDNSFTANWSGGTAPSYTLNVYTKTVLDPIDETEGFSGFEYDANGKITDATFANNSGWSYKIGTASVTPQGYFTPGNYGSSGSPALSFSRSGQYVETALYPSPITTLAFWAYEQGSCTVTGSEVIIDGFDGNTWQTIVTEPLIVFSSADIHTYDLSSLGFENIYRIRISYLKDKCNLAIDDIQVVTAPQEGKSYVTGYEEKPVGDVNEYAVEGLTSGTTYYYTVQSGDCVSNEITVKLPLMVFDANAAVGKWTLISSALAGYAQSDFTFGTSSAAFKRLVKPVGTGNYTWATVVPNTTPGVGFAYQVNPAIVETSELWLSHGGQRWYYSPRVAHTDASYTVDVESGVEYALVGNPYYEDIDLSDFSGTGLSIEGYYTTNNNNSTFPLSPTTAVSKWQGIIVSTSAEGGGTLGTPITITKPVTGGPAPAPAPAVFNGKMTVTAANNNGSSTTYINNKSTGTSIVGSKDMSFFNMGANQIVQVYTSKNKSNGAVIKLALNTINDDVTTVPLGVFTTYEGNVVLTLNGMDTYSCDITLLDYLTGAEVNLTGLSTYDYPISVSGNTDSRFALYFGSRIPTSNPQIDNVNIQAFVRDGKINIVSTDELQNVRIYSVSGSQIADLNISGRSYIVNNQLPAGVYLVTIQTTDRVLTQKVVVK